MWSRSERHITLEVGITSTGYIDYIKCRVGSRTDIVCCPWSSSTGSYIMAERQKTSSSPRIAIGHSGNSCGICDMHRIYRPRIDIQSISSNILSRTGEINILPKNRRWCTCSEWLTERSSTRESSLPSTATSYSSGVITYSGIYPSVCSHTSKCVRIANSSRSRSSCWEHFSCCSHKWMEANTIPSISA